MLTSRSGLACLLVLASMVLAPLASAQPIVTRAQVVQRGDFVLIGNTLGFDCGPGTPAPIVGTVGACGTNTADSAMDVFWRADSPAAGMAEANTAITIAQARSTAQLVLPAGASVTHAFVYWAATVPAGGAADANITLDRAGAGGFSTAVTAIASPTVMAGATLAYQSVADVTELVRTNGAGAYRVSGVDAFPLPNVNNSTVFAGWWMVVLYERASDPVRALSVADGLGLIIDGAPITATLSGFVVPPVAGTARLGVIGYEGDNAIAGDQLFVNGGAPFSDAQSPADNFFNGTRSYLGAPRTVSGDLPQLTGTAQSNPGVELDEIDITTRLSPGATSATIQAASIGDSFFFGGLVSAITTTSPDFGSSQKRATDLDGGDVLPGDTIEYALTITNSGNEPAVATVVSDVLPVGVTFVPGSLSVTFGANVGAKTDAPGDDQAEYDAATRTVRFRVGTGANAATGGSLASLDSTVVRFRVTVDAGVVGAIDNQASITANGATSGRAITGATDSDASPGSTPTRIFVDACSTNAQCAYPTAICDAAPTPNVCVACLFDADCEPLTPTCSANTCVCVPTGAELCNGRDDDCNGMIDETDPAAGVACSSGLPGVCDPGVSMCVSAGIACVPTVAPGSMPESCNEIDDDCDGTVDQGFDLGTSCVAGVGACEASGVVVCDGAGGAVCDAIPGEPETEICGDGIDDDCNGMADDCDAGTLVDASVTGDAGTLVDAGVRSDGGDASTDDDGGTSTGMTSGGCGCHLAGRSDASASMLLLAGLALVIARRRRR